MKKGTFVIVRTASAGVHFGNYVYHKGQEVKLSNARRLWSWNGALSLNEVSQNGIDLSRSKVSVPVAEIILPTAIEIIEVNSKSNLPGNEQHAETPTRKSTFA